jgi:hypothetical protein
MYGSLRNDKKFDNFVLLRGLKMMQTLNARFRHVVVAAFAAAMIAALLRHTVHVYWGYSREEIRAAALLAVPVVALFLAVLGSKKPQ